MQARKEFQHLMKQCLKTMHVLLNYLKPNTQKMSAYNNVCNIVQNSYLIYRLSNQQKNHSLNVPYLETYSKSLITHPPNNYCGLTA